MKAQLRLTLFIVAMFTLLTNVACTKSSSDGGGSTAAAASTLSLQSATVAPGGTINLIPSGGTPPYTFSLQSTIGGSLTSYTTYTTLTAPTVAGTITVTVTDSASATATSTITVSGTSSTLTVSPLSTTVAPGGTVSYIVSGGTGTITYTATAGTFVGNVFTAPATAQTVTVTIADGGGNSVLATVLVSGPPVVSASCGGTFAANIAGYSGTITFVENSAGTISGSLDYHLPGYFPAALSGSCTAGGTISFTDLYSGSVFSGTYFVNPTTNKTVMTGTFNYSGTYSWFAVEQ